MISIFAKKCMETDICAREFNTIFPSSSNSFTRRSPILML